MERQNKLYVGNFPFSWTEDDLEQVFNDYKDRITDIKIIYDQFSGRSKGFAFVTFDDDEVAKQALALSKTPAGDRTLVVSHARPPSNGGGGGGGGGRSFDRSDRGDRHERGQRSDHDRGDKSDRDRGGRRSDY